MQFNFFSTVQNDSTPQHHDGAQFASLTPDARYVSTGRVLFTSFAGFHKEPHSSWYRPGARQSAVLSCYLCRMQGISARKRSRNCAKLTVTRIALSPLIGNTGSIETTTAFRLEQSQPIRFNEFCSPGSNSLQQGSFVSNLGCRAGLVLWPPLSASHSEDLLCAQSSFETEPKAHFLEISILVSRRGGVNFQCRPEQ